MMKRQRYVSFAALLFLWTKLLDVKTQNLCQLTRRERQEVKMGLFSFFLFFVISFLNTGMFSAFNHVLTLPSLNRTHSVLTCVVGTVLFHGRRHPTGRRSHSATGMKIFTAACAVVGSWAWSQNVPKILINISKRFLKASNSRKRSSPNSFTSIWATEQ